MDLKILIYLLYTKIPGLMNNDPDTSTIYWQPALKNAAYFFKPIPEAAWFNIYLGVFFDIHHTVSSLSLIHI